MFIITYNNTDYFEIVKLGLTHPVQSCLFYCYRMFLYEQGGYRHHHIEPSGFSWFSSFLKIMHEFWRKTTEYKVTLCITTY